MKKLLLLSLLFPLTILAQNEFGYHATWHFNYGDFGEFGYKKVTHAGDTNMLNMHWLKFEVTGLAAMKTGPSSSDVILLDSNKVFPNIYLATRNDSVFRLLDSNTAFLLFDLNAQPGDKWQFAPSDTALGCDSIPTATVTGVGTDTIDGQVVRFMDLAMPMDTVYYGSIPNYQPVSGQVINSRIYPDFGSFGYISLFDSRPNACDGTVIDFFVGNALSCFNNDSMSISFSNKACDFVPYISIKEVEAVSFQVYPNPSQGKISIQAEERVSRVEVYSMEGQKLMESVRSEHIDLPSTSGMYLVAIYFENGSQAMQRIIRK